MGWNDGTVAPDAPPAGGPPPLPISPEAIDLSITFISSTVVLLAITLACMAVRIWTRARAGWAFGLDDIFIFIGCVGSLRISHPATPKKPKKKPLCAGVPNIETGIHDCRLGHADGPDH